MGKLSVAEKEQSFILRLTSFLKKNRFPSNLTGMPNIFAEKSDQTWVEGSDCLNRGQINTAANRIYYAVFQAVKGFAIQTKQMSMEDNSNVHRQVLQIVSSQGARRGLWRRQLGAFNSPSVEF